MIDFDDTLGHQQIEKRLIENTKSIGKIKKEMWISKNVSSQKIKKVPNHAVQADRDIALGNFKCARR